MINSSKESVDKILYGYYNNIVQSVSNAFSKFNEDYFSKIHILSATTVANIINDLVRDELTSFSRQSDGFNNIRNGNSFFLKYDSFAMRPKKVDNSLASGNVQTQRISDIKNQQLILPGLEDNTSYLTLGYRLDTLYQLSGVFLIKEMTSGNSWRIRIDNLASCEQMILDNVYIEETKPQKSRVKIRKEIMPSVTKEA